MILSSRNFIIQTRRLQSSSGTRSRTPPRFRDNFIKVVSKRKNARRRRWSSARDNDRYPNHTLGCKLLLINGFSSASPRSATDSVAHRVAVAPDPPIESKRNSSRTRIVERNRHARGRTVAACTAVPLLTAAAVVGCQYRGRGEGKKGSEGSRGGRRSPKTAH